MLDRNTIRRTLIDLLHDEVGEDFSNVADGNNLRTELGLDSVDVVSVISQIERLYHIRMSRAELEKLATVGDVLDLLEVKIGNPGTESTGAAA